MEYGLAVAAPAELPADPRSWCSAPWRETLPEGEIAAVYFGSEFCEHRLPSAREAATFCRFAEERGLEAVLLTPLVRAPGLEAVAHLLDRLRGEGHAPSVVFNDWGVLSLLRERHPTLARRGGRLLNRALRDPRLAAEGVVPRPEGGEGRASHLRALLLRLGAVAVETDPDLEGGFLGPAGSLQRALHLPYVFAASGRNCLPKASESGETDSFTRGLGSGCAAPCGGEALSEVRADTALPLWRAGNTLFYEAPRALALGHLGQADRVVLHGSPTP